MDEVTPRPASRPSLINPTRLSKILKATADGQTFKAAAESAGTSRPTAHRWKAAGERALALAKVSNPHLDIDDIIDDWLQIWPDNFLPKNGMWDAPIPAPFTDQTQTEWHLVLFVILLEKARSIAEVKLVNLIRRHGKNQWQAAAWLLERRNRVDYGRNQTIEHTGPDGGPVQIEAASSEEVLAKIAEFKRMKAEKNS